MWIARDKDGTLLLFNYEPIRSNIFSSWEVDTEKSSSSDDYLVIDDNLFPNLRWEDEPIEVSMLNK